MTHRYGLREALAIVAEEGLENMWARHTKVAQHLWTGLSDLNLEPFVEKPEDRLITVNTIKACPCSHGCACMQNIDTVLRVFSMVGPHLMLNLADRGCSDVFLRGLHGLDSCLPDCWCEPLLII